MSILTDIIKNLRLESQVILVISSYISVLISADDEKQIQHMTNIVKDALKVLEFVIDCCLIDCCSIDWCAVGVRLNGVRLIGVRLIGVRLIGVRLV